MGIIASIPSTMLKRVASIINNKKDKDGEAPGPSNGASADRNSKNGTSSARRSSSFFKKSSTNVASVGNQPDHSVNQTSISDKLTEFGQLVHRVKQPLPSQTGDGTYIEESTPTGLWDDLKAMRIKDFETLEMKLKDELSGSE